LPRDNPEQKSDCSRCAGLCCVALPFDKSDDFAFDKAAEEPCRHLGGDFRCAIHAQLEDRGFRGCVAYECYGAGQRVTQDVFDGRNWRDEPALARRMFGAFGAMRVIHELLMLLRMAGQLDLTVTQRQELHALQARLMPDSGWSEDTLAAFETTRIRAEANAFLKTLQPQSGALRGE